MGSKIWAVDIILQSLFHPMLNAYTFDQYEKAAKLLFLLNSFLVGYGEGVDLPPVKAIMLGIKDRGTPDGDYKRYFNKYAPIVLKSMGMYIKSVLDALKNQIYIPKGEYKEGDDDLGIEGTELLTQ